MHSQFKHKWKFADPVMETVEQLVEKLKVSHILGKLMVNRGIQSIEEGKFFLEAQLNNLPDPFEMRGMKEAVERIITAIKNREQITIFGDYDVDGVTSTALMIHFFRELNTPFDYYLPDRMEEGYGVNEDALDEIKSRGSSIVITADCGITAVKQVDYAQSIGLDVIVTDHHQISDEGLPKALAILNPHQPDCDYPFKFLSGVGIVFKFALGIRRGLLDAGWKANDLPNLKQHLDLFTLGTIGDMAPLTGENHVLTSHGLEEMRISTKPGLVALKSIAGINGKVDSFSIGFGLGPRLNAAGRLGKADHGLDLLVSSNLNDAMDIAKQLDCLNEERKETQKWSQKEAEYLIERQVDLEKDRVIVLASENFHQGVIGIVAAKIVQMFYRPTVLIALKDGVGKGSARSIPTFNLFKAFTNCSEHLIRYGGHAYAAGLNIEENKIDDFRKAINEVGHQFLTDDKLIPEINVDTTVLFRDLTPEFFDCVQNLGPFGQVNTQPVFHSKAIQVRDLKWIGKEKNHVRFRAFQEGDSINVIGFKLASVVKKLDLEQPMDIVYELHPNDWNGRLNLELKLIDIKPSQNLD